MAAAYGPARLSRRASLRAGSSGLYTVYAYQYGADNTFTYTISMTGSTALPYGGKTLGAPRKANNLCYNCTSQAQVDGSQVSDGHNSVGGPIDLASGNMNETALDYTTVGPNPLAFIRYYNSQQWQSNLQATSLGPNWRSNYDRYLRLVSSSLAQAERPDGQVINFKLVSSVSTSDTDEDYSLSDSSGTWTLTGPDDTKESYSGTSGVLPVQSITLRNGYAQTLTYTSGQLTSVSDSYSRSLTLTYTGTELTGLSTPDSITFTYGYTSTAGQNLLTSVTYNTSPATSITYLYENSALPFHLTGIDDELANRYATWAYDGYGRALSSKFGDTLGADYTQVSYDDSTGNRTVTGPLGIADTYKFTAYQGIPKITEIDRAANSPVAAATRTFTYDSNGYLATMTDWDGNSTHYTNNSHGHPTMVVEAYGSTVARTTTIAYDSTWVRLPYTITTTGLTTTNNYDSSTGNLLTKVLTDTTTTSTPYSTNGQTRTWTYSYTSTGQLASVQLPRTDVTAKTSYAYTGGVLTSITDPLSHTTNITSYTGGGLPTRIVNSAGVPFTLAYDGRLRLNTVTQTVNNLTTTWTHDAAGNLTYYNTRDGVNFTYTYDAAHRLINITDWYNDTLPLTLDAAGNVTQALWKNSSGTTTRQHSATFDAVGNKLTDVGGMSQTTSYGYDSQSNLTSIQTPLTWTTGQTPDALNRIATITDPYSNTIVTSYDAHDRPLTVKDPNGNSTSYVYDGFGEAIQVSSPDSGTTVYYYDKDGNVSQKTDATGNVTNWTYDAEDRPLTRTYPADSTLNVSYTYDQTTPGHTLGIDHLTSLTDQVGSLTLTYDEYGNVGTSSRAIGTNTYTTSYLYWAERSISTIVYPSGWTIYYGISAADNIDVVNYQAPGSSMVSPIANYVANMPFGPVKSFTFGNGATSTRTFDADYRMTGMTDSGSGTIEQLSYGYDADNNVHTITDALNAANSQTLTYDHLERLTGAASGTGGYGTLSYGYDANGNRTSDTGTTYTIASSSNRVTAIGSTSVSYTATGNITGYGSNAFTYNKANQMASGTNGSASGTYGYDAFGQRTTATTLGSPQVYIHDTWGDMIAELDNGYETDYVYLNHAPVAVIDPAAGTVSYISSDRLGTPQLATDSSQATVWQAYYQPFGATPGPVGSITQNLRLPGQYADDTGFNHNGFRNYNPAIGRYLEADPLGLAAGTNVYAYAGSNPGARIDPLGLDSLDLVALSVEDRTAQDSYTNPGRFTVGAHGYGYGFLLFHPGIVADYYFATGGNYLHDFVGTAESVRSSQALSVEDVGNKILSSKWNAYGPHELIELDICYAAKGGENSFAAKLASYLAQKANAPVDILATPAQFQLYTNGRIASDPGDFQSFVSQPKN